MKRQLAASVAVLAALFGCQQDKATVEQAREAEQIEFISGQVLDCAGDLDEAARIVCADSDLRALDRRIAELWTETVEATGRPATLAWRHQQWLTERRAGERDWGAGENRPRSQAELRDFYQAYADTLSEELRLARALPEATALSALGGGCIGEALRGCRAPAAGFLTGPGGQRLAWQLQEGSTDFQGVTAGVVLFSIANDVMTPVGWSFEGAHFQAPVIFTNGDAVYVAAKGFQQGTGGANSDVLYRLDGEQWSEIEVESWKMALDDQLPDGLNVWKGVDYDWPSMSASSSLWRDDDANCCPTGGDAFIDFAVQGRALTLAAVTVQSEP